MENAKVIPVRCACAIALVLLAGALGGLGQWWAAGSSLGAQPARVGELLATAWEAALVEEVLFRGVLLWACLAWARRWNKRHLKGAASAGSEAGFLIAADPTRVAIVVSSLAFGLLHLLPAGPLIAPGASLAVVVAQAILKVAQAALFGVVMALLVVRSPYAWADLPLRLLALVAPVIIHGFFDLLFLGPLLLTGGVLPSTYLTGNVADLLPLAVTTILLAGAVKLSFGVWSPAEKRRS